MSGLLLMAFLFIAFAIIKFAILTIDSFLRLDPIKRIDLQLGISFIALAVIAILIILTGILKSYAIGWKLLRKPENILLKIPFFNVIYSAAKNALEGLALRENRTFEKTVMGEFFQKALFVSGFWAGRIEIYSALGAKAFRNVLIVSALKPFFSIKTPVMEGDTMILDMPVDEGIIYSVSGSLAAQRSWRVVEKYNMGRLAAPVKIYY